MQTAEQWQNTPFQCSARRVFNTDIQLCPAPAAQMLVVMNDEICGTNTYTEQYSTPITHYLHLTAGPHNATMLQLGDDIFPWLIFNFN